MIDGVWVSHVAKSIEDFDELVRLLNALGMRTGHISEDEYDKFGAFYPSVSRLNLIGYKRKSKRSFRHPAIWLFPSDPMSAFEVVKKLGFKVVSGRADRTMLAKSFEVRLPSGTRISIGAPTQEARPEFQVQTLGGKLSATGKRFGIVVSRFNAFITERLFHSAFDALLRCGARQRNIDVVRVPGAFEIPSAARALAETKKYDAIICLGCLLRGDTAHYDVIVNEVTRGIGQSAQETGVPHAFGVLTCDTLEQAIDRAGLKMGNKGFEAALAAVEMANLKNAVAGRSSLAVRNTKAISSQRSTVRKTRERKPARPKKRRR
jgi:6,7-dimethyl-8-ribityllumazine synthase